MRLAGGFPSPALHGSSRELKWIDEHSIKRSLVEQLDGEPQEAGGGIPKPATTLLQKGNMMNKITAFAFGAAIGCAIGALAALALAPRTGAETRELVAEQAEKLSEGAKNFGTEASYYRDDIVRNVKSASDELLQNIKGELPMGEEELRAKIEEARDRIAARMAAGFPG